MLIKVDVREKDMLQVIEKRPAYTNNIDVQGLALPLGDCIICDPDGTERVIIERKTLRDLAASIRDGRYNEQSCRLSACSVHNHQIIYLIEGNLEEYIAGHSHVTKDALISAMISLNFFKGFSVHRTLSIEESVTWLFQLAKKLGSKSQPGYFETGGGVPQKYGEVVKRIKKDCVTKDNIGAIMLSQIPNVSHSIAEGIMNQYKNINNLIQVLQQDPDALACIKLTGKTGKSRTIPKPARENIFKFLVEDVKE